MRLTSNINVLTVWYTNMRASELVKIDPILDFIKQHHDKDLSSGNCGVFAIAVDKLFGVDSFVFAENEAEPDRLYHVAVVKNGRMYDGHGVTNADTVKEYAYDEDFPENEPVLDIVPASDNLYRFILKGTEPNISVDSLTTPKALTESTEYPITVSRPNRLTPDQLRQVQALISAGGEVRTDTLLAGLQRAQLIAIAEDAGQVIAVTAVKTPVESYRTAVFTKAGVPELLNKYRYESGFSYTDPNYRSTGISAQLHRQLFQQAQEPLFSTVRTENRVALLGLQRMGFKPIGEPFASERSNYTITLLVNK